MAHPARPLQLEEVCCLRGAGRRLSFLQVHWKQCGSIVWRGSARVLKEGERVLSLEIQC